jgi:Xaa-Pro aminopeptidase
MNIINERLTAVRQLMEKKGFDALIVSSADPHGSEYVADRYQNRVWLSGFTGSAGTIIVTLNEALLWVDSRYYIQGEQQIEGTDFSLMKLDYNGTPDPISWLKKSLKEGSTVAFEYLSFSISYLRKLKEKLDSKNINFVDASSFFDQVWKERKALPFSEVKEVSVSIVGQSREDKIEAILKRIKELGCNVTIVSSLDDIAWILNLRGDDVPFNPLLPSQSFFLSCRYESGHCRHLTNQ